jgi:hypothetical protein
VRLAEPSHASAIFETIVTAVRRGRLRAGDEMIALSDGMERRGAVNLVSTPLLAAEAAQPAGRRAVMRRLVQQGAAPAGVLSGITVRLPEAGSPRCGAPYSESRGRQIELLWTKDWAARTGAEVHWR